VSISSNALFVITLAAIVGIAGAPVAEDLWLWFVAGAVTVVVLALVWTLLDFSYVHRRLDPDGDARRRHALLLLALSPIGAIRSAAAAGRDVYAAWDPLAVAHAHCDADEFRRVAQEALCELRHPPPRGDAADAAIRRCEEWTRSAQLASVERLLTARGLDPASLLAPPVPLRATNRAWCPRCRVQYEIPSGACADCGGVPLVAFEEASRAG
jgi:hypothetical protein